MLSDTDPSGEGCARLVGGAVILAAGTLSGVEHPGLDRDRAVIELGIGLTVVLMRVIAHLNAKRASMPKPTPPASRSQNPLTITAPVVDHCLVLRAPGAADADKVPDEQDFSANGLVASVPRGIALRTGTAGGLVLVKLSVVEGEPELQLDRWDEIVDVSISTSEPTLASGDGVAPGRSPSRIWNGERVSASECRRQAWPVVDHPPRPQSP